MAAFAPGVDGGDRQVLGEAARASDADADGIATEVALAGEAVAALTTDDMTLARDALADRKPGHRRFY